MIHDSRPLAIAPDERLNGDGEDHSRDMRSAGEIHARLMEAEAELWAMKAGAGMIQRVGQRFVDGFGDPWLVVGRDEDAIDPWLLRGKEGQTLHFSDDGVWISKTGGTSKFNLIGPAPDELAEAKADAQRYLARIKSLERKLGALVPKADFDEATADTGLMVNEESFVGMIELAARDNLRKLLIDHEAVWLHAGLPKSRTVTVGNVSPVTDWMDIEARRVESEDGEIGYVLSVKQSVRR